MSTIGWLIKVVFKTGLVLLLIFMWLWGAFALYLSGPGPHWLNIALASVFVVFLPGLFIFCRSFFKTIVICLSLFALLLLWWQTLQPTGDKDWAPAVAQISHGSIKDNILTMNNVRNFHYTTENDFLEQWETRAYNFDNLQGVDIFLSYWASEHIAHTILSWDFGEDGHLAVSIETRKDKTQQYSAIKGFFKQFELAYVAADEEDIIRLRTNIWKERVYLYRLDASKERIRTLLEQYLKEMNSLVEQPEFYHALTHNCTTTIQVNADAVRTGAPPPLDWRLIASGHVDELLYDRGIIKSDLPFSELRTLSRVDLVLQKQDNGDFSEKMRKEIKLPKTSF